jgi:predicted Zn-dependent protease
MFNALKAGFTVDEEKTDEANLFFKEMHIPASYHIRITVVKKDIPNAFALPGGHVIVYDRLLSGLEHYEQLAALLSHEFIHIQYKHTTKALFRQIGNSIFLSIIPGNTHAISNFIISHADQVKNLSYSRSLEKEADLAGLHILTERKINGNGYTGLFELLKRQKEIPVSEWMSSHPALENRIQYILKDPSFNKNGVEENKTLRSVFMKLKSG